MLLSQYGNDDNGGAIVVSVIISRNAIITSDCEYLGNTDQCKTDIPIWDERGAWVDVIIIDWLVIAERIDEKITEAHLTYKMIEDATGAPHSSVSRLRKGEAKDPSFELILQVCDALDISPGALFAGAIHRYGQVSALSDKAKPEKKKKEIKKHESVAYHTGLQYSAVTELNFHASDPYFSEFLDGELVENVQWELAHIASRASELCAYRESAVYKSYMKDFPDKIRDEERKKLDNEISGHILTIHQSVHKKLMDFAERYVLHNGKRSDRLINGMKERKRNGNNPQENK